MILYRHCENRAVRRGSYGNRVDRVFVRFYFGAGHCFGSPVIMKPGLRNDNIFYIIKAWHYIILYNRYHLAVVL